MLPDDNVAARKLLVRGIKCLLVFGLLCLGSLTAPPLQAQPSPELELLPEEGRVGDSITLHGTGFGPLAGVFILVSGDEIPTSPGAVATDEAGELTAEFEIPFFTPAGTFVVQVIEDSENETSATVELTVANTPPVADQQAPISIDENESVLVGLTASDDNGDTLTLQIVGEPAHGSLSEFDEDTGEILYTPDDGYDGTDSFSFKANDGLEDSAITPVNITISGTNDLPVAFDESVELHENSKKKIKLEASDADDDTLTYSIVSDPDHGNLTGTPPNLYYEPYDDYSGSDSFRFTASDAFGTSNIATISIFVVDDEEDYDYESEEEYEEEAEYDYANSKPVGISQSVAGLEDEPVLIVLTGEDLDDDPLTFEIATYPSHGEIAEFEESGELTYVPAQEYSGTDSFAFIARDHQKESKPATVSIFVSAVNDPPKPVSMNLTASDGTVNFTLAASDAEGDPLQFSIFQAPANGTLIGVPPELFYAAEPGFAGYDKILFTVTDNRTETWIGVVSILVEQEPLDTSDESEYEQDNSDEELQSTTGGDLVTDADEHDQNAGEKPKDDPAEESTTKARADKSKVLVMVSWDHHGQNEGVESTLHLKFAEHRTRIPLGSHIWYDLVMLDDSNKEILRKHDLVALDSEDVQRVTFPANGTYHFEVNVKGLIDKSSNAVTRDMDYTGKAFGTVVVPEFNSMGILLAAASVMGSIVVFARRKINSGSLLGP